ncbi:hypothetical protein [Methanogenium organophilum]|uniref:Uncharacterized protein n=1 Tax=Methanogenium organophilum TaxID=2199 RepID=A0A9X9S1H2_METOG|nr:hypothetical protein [Methanogenium organophilum]WAI00138.1 hypothetical protein OU421_06760 [Methanogenium organophilum]
MKERIGAEGPYVLSDVTITPIFQCRTTAYPGGGMGEKEPLGLLIHAGTTLRIVSFTGSYAWWNELIDAYPELQTLQAVFQEQAPQTQKK